MDVGAEGSLRPSGVVTFLFTDIEGSTRRWEADAEAMRSALEAHDAVLREAVEKYSGWLFKHTGDGICAAFSSPRSAVDAAIAAQRSLELPVRMGLATGEAEHRDGDYFGAALNRASRIMSAGHGGQILLDGVTSDLISDVDLLRLGPKRLRDIAKPIEVLQVRAPGLALTFPPLKTDDPAPGNLRPSSTSFVGRDAALADVAAALDAHRLVTLIGVGGVGKTRLAMETAARVVGKFPDGVWVVELAAVSDPTAVPEAVAATLGITPQPGMTVAESVATALEGRTRLLLFDNCEHVLDSAADLINAILAKSPAAKVLATSREGLRLADERLWPVPSLDVQSSAVTLFGERATAVAPSVSLDGSKEVVAEICLRLDGIPLAIELAASRMQSMSVTEVRDRLDDRFRLLVGSRRGLERHQTLHHAVQWSFDLLRDAEKDLLTRCSVFAGGFDVAAAYAISCAEDEYVTLDLLDELVRKSLVVADRTSARTRFTMLETIRQFAEEQLVATMAAEEARAAHARYFAAREEDVLNQWDSAQQGKAYQWYAVEVGNLRTAYRWAADNGDLDSAAAVAFISAFIGSWSYQHEATGWAEELIEPAKTMGHGRLAQLYAACAQCHVNGRVQDAVGYADACRSAAASGLFDPIPHDYGVWVGAAYMVAGIPERWIDLCRDLMARGSDGISTQTCLAMALTFGGVSGEAITASEGLRTAFQSSHNPCMNAWARLAYGLARRDTDPETSYTVQRKALSIALESGNRLVASHLADGLSRLSAMQGDPSHDGFDLTALAIRLHYDAGSFYLLCSPLASLAALLVRLGRHEPAATISGFAATPLVFTTFPELAGMLAELRGTLGEAAYESLARTGVEMTPAELAAYAFGQIDLARAELG